MLNQPFPQRLIEPAAQMAEGQARVVVLGATSMAYYHSLFAPIIQEERLRSVQAAVVCSLLSAYPGLLLEDLDSLLGALELAMIVGMLAGKQHALEIPPELASLVQPMAEAER